MSLHPSRCNGYVVPQGNRADRRLRVRRLVPLFALLLALGAPGTAAAERPNILVVMTDDQRFDGTMGVMPETRRLIMRQGTTFQRAHATTPKCCPSRATFFSGQYAHNHKVTNNNVPARLDQSRTVQRFLQERGYRTAIFGKYLNAWPLKVDPPFFDDWAITSGAFRQGSWNQNGRVGVVRGYNTDIVADRTVGFIRLAERRDDDQPWLAWVTPSAPHVPSTPASRHRNAPLARFPTTPAILEEDFSDKPDFLDRVRGYPELIAQARDDGRRTLMAVDEMVARLVAELKRRKELARTLIVFTSDNGFLLGEHGGLVGKDLPYPQSTRIPLAVRWDGRVGKGRNRWDFVTNVDVATTILRVAGVRRGTDGKSLFAKRRRKTLFLESFGAKNNRGGLILPPWHTVRTGDYRFTEYRQLDGDLIAREYYDHREDPWELDNAIASLTPSRVAKLSNQLQRLSRCKGRGCP